MRKQLFLLLFSCSAVRCSASSDTELQAFLDLGGESTTVYCIRYSGRSTHQGSACVAPCPDESEWDRVINSSGLGTRYLGMQSSLLSLPFCPPLLTRLATAHYGTCDSNTVQYCWTAGQASPNKEFCTKISERLKIQFLFSRSRPPPPSTHDPRPWSLPARTSPGTAGQLAFPYRFRPWILSPGRYITADHKTRLSISRLPWLGECEIEQSRDEHDALDALFDPFGPI